MLNRLAGSVGLIGLTILTMACNGGPASPTFGPDVVPGRGERREVPRLDSFVGRGEGVVLGLDITGLYCTLWDAPKGHPTEYGLNRFGFDCVGAGRFDGLVGTRKARGPLTVYVAEGGLGFRGPDTDAILRYTVPISDPRGVPTVGASETLVQTVVVVTTPTSLHVYIDDVAL